MSRLVVADTGPLIHLAQADALSLLELTGEVLVLVQYLDGELDREEAIERVGRPKVERAERERKVVEEAIDWGLNA